jgi:hypothetical protein
MRFRRKLYPLVGSPKLSLNLLLLTASTVQLPSCSPLRCRRQSFKIHPCGFTVPPDLELTMGKNRRLYYPITSLNPSLDQVLSPFFIILFPSHNHPKSCRQSVQLSPNSTTVYPDVGLRVGAVKQSLGHPLTSPASSSNWCV